MVYSKNSAEGEIYDHNININSKILKTSELEELQKKQTKPNASTRIGK